MAPRQKVEFTVVRLSYLAYIDPLYPQFTSTRKKALPCTSVEPVRDWFERVVCRERRKLPPNASIRYTEWRISTSNISLFSIHDYRFDKILLILAESNDYWLYYQNMPIHRRLEGNGVLPVSYCSCCFDHQYLKVMQSVKEATLKRIF